jgi:uncharacterized protein YhfF/GrpB-like predicted nucleotidyltransferase (UPF0157 family)
MPLGLDGARALQPEHGAVEIVPHRESWAADYVPVRDRVRCALGAEALRIDHIGSTAVAGLAAKNVIDVQVSVGDVDAAIRPLQSAGFRPHPTIARDHAPPGASGPPDDWRKLLFVEAAGERRANVHVRRAGSANERYALLVRDYLRAQPLAAAAYAELKRRLAASLGDVDRYADVKDPAVDLIYFAAEQWASATSWTVARPRVPAPLSAFWNRFVAATGGADESRFYESFYFSDSEAVADELADLVVRGTKRATAASLWSHDDEAKPLPRPGDLRIVTDWAGEPRCIIETKSVEIVPFCDVSAEFAATEGEGDGSLAFWRDAHREYFTRECARAGREFGDDMLVVCERFEVVYRPTEHA